MTTDQDKKLLTRQQVAETLQVHPRTIARWEDKDLLRPIRLSARCLRYRAEDVERLLQRLVG